jgi:hypothetical protein
MQKRANSSQNTLNISMKEFIGIDKEEFESVTKAAYSKARREFMAEAFLELSNDVRDMIYEDKTLRYKGYRLLAIDGSMIRLPNEKRSDLRRYFKPTRVKNQIKGYKKEVIQARASVLYDVMNEVVIDCYLKNGVKDEEIESYDERRLALMHLKECKRDDIVIMDRGYPSYKVIEAFDKNAKFVIRIRKNSFKEAKELFEGKEKEKIAIIKRPSNIDDKNIREKVKVRFVRVDLPNNEVEVLITNIFDKNFKQEDFKEIYARRWGIETFYDLIKNRLGLENFTGYSYDAIMQDFYITMLLTNLETMYTMDIKLQLKKNEEMKRLNKSVTFNAIKENIIGLFFREDLDLDTMINNLEKLFKSSIEIVRKKENKKRNKKEKTKEIRDSLHFHKRKKKVV